MIGWLALLAGALAFSVVAWLRGRPRSWLFPSDAFFLLCVLTSGVVPFVNLYAASPVALSYVFSYETVRTTLICLTLMYLSMGIVWTLRSPIRLPDLLPYVGRDGAEIRARDQRRASKSLWAAAIFLVVISTLALGYGPYLQYKIQVIKFLTAQITPTDYQLARRVTYVSDDFINSIMGRLRYAIFPMLFVSASVLAVRKLGVFRGLLLSALIFALGPASMSKAPMVIYLVYFSLACLLVKRVAWPLRAKNAILGIFLSLGVLLLLLTGIYLLQYRESLSGAEGLVSAFELAYFRVFVATYNGLLQYMTVFPSGDVGTAGSVIGPLFGHEVRNLDQEVAIFFLGYNLGQLTTFPTIFIGNAFASFGYIGVVVFSLLVAGAMAAVDHLYVRIRNGDLRIVYYATMMVNVTYFAVLAAPTALITYGCAIIPLLVWSADRMVGAANRRRRPAGLTVPIPATIPSTAAAPGSGRFSR